MVISSYPVCRMLALVSLLVHAVSIPKMLLLLFPIILDHTQIKPAYLIFDHDKYFRPTPCKEPAGPIVVLLGAVFDGRTNV